MKPILAVLAAAALQAAPAPADTAADNTRGFSMCKPPKSREEWEIKSESGSLTIVHKVHPAAVVVSFATVINANNFNTKNAAEDNWKGISASGKYKDLKKKGVWQCRLPGGGAGGANTHRLDMTFTADDGNLMTWKVYHFNNRFTTDFYMVSVIGEAVAAAKCAADLDAILASIRVFKPAK